MSQESVEKNHPRMDLSRRGFLRGAGALSAAPLLAPLANEFQVEDKSVTTLGPGAVPCVLNVNGKPYDVKIEPRATLLEVLRHTLDLTGSKEVCGRGSCGACTVHVDGVPMNSCLMLAVDAIGAQITTIEGLGTPEKLDPVQAAFVRHDGLQCGYCTPGFVMSVKSLLARNPKPSVDDVKHACAGNICRCGTYNKIFEAALTAAGIQAPAGNVADNGKAAWENEGTRHDGPQKVTGRAKFTADVHLPNMAYAAIVFCPYGRAKLKTSNVEAARKVAGVLDVELNTQREEYVYSGQPAGHVCAENPAALGDGIAALDLKWEILTPVLDPVAEHQAKHGPIPTPLEKSGANEETQTKVKEAFEKASKVVEHTYETQIQTHCCLEPHGAVADYRGDSAEIWVSSQATGAIFNESVKAYGLSPGKVKAHCEFVGGGFGSKFGIDAEGALAARLSKQLKRPVRVVNDRKREQLDTGCRPGSIQYMKVAINDAGEPQGGRIHVVGVSGPGGGGDASNPSRYQFGPIARSFVDLDLSVGAARAMRAPGSPQGMFAVDSFVDELAAAAGVDPLEYRKKVDTNQIRHKMFAIGAERIGWNRRPQPDGSGPGRIKRGLGMGVGDWFNRPGNAQIRIDVFRDGTLRVLSGTQDIGSGTKTVLVDTVAHHLGLDRKLISADTGCSDYPEGPASGGSTVTRVIVPAIRDAADKAREELSKISGGEVDAASWRDACKKIAGEKFTVTGSHNSKYYGKGSSEAVQFAEVEVDTETGLVRVLRVVAVQNCGRAVNRLLAESQIVGGVIQGCSYALYEEKLLDPKTGAMVNPNLEQYKILGPRDCPEIEPIIWTDEGDDLGARSLGEPPVVPTAGAVANAIANAIGTRVRSLPITPAKILAALASMGGAK